MIRITSTTTNVRLTAHPDGSPVRVTSMVGGYQGATGPAGAAGPAGADSTVPGPAGADGVGVPAGGAAGEVLGKASATDYDTAWVPAGTGSGAASGQILFFDNTASDLTLPTVTGATFSAGNANPDTITTTGTSFVTLGFTAGMKIKTTGFANGANNGTFVVTIVAADKLTLATTHALTAEAAGATVTITTDRERITRAPATGTQQDESQAIVLADGDVSLDTYLTPIGYPGTVAVSAGIWNFHAWSWVSSTAGTTTTMKFRVLKVNTAGVETTLFTTTAQTITSTSATTPTVVEIAYTVTAPITVLTTDRIAVRVIGNTSSATARTLHFLYQGSVYASHVETTLPIAGVGVPVGGTAGQYLRKTSSSDYDTAWAAIAQSEVTGLTTALANKVGSATITTIWYGTAAAYAAIGSKDSATLYVVSA